METAAPGFYTGRSVHPSHIMVRMSGAMLCGEQLQENLRDMRALCRPHPQPANIPGI